VIAEHEHVGHQADLFGARRQVAERRQRIPVGGAPHLAGAERHSYVLAASHVVVAESVGRLGDHRDLLDPRVVFPRRMGVGPLEHDWSDDPKLHLGAGVYGAARLWRSAPTTFS